MLLLQVRESGGADEGLLVAGDTRWADVHAYCVQERADEHCDALAVRLISLSDVLAPVLI